MTTERHRRSRPTTVDRRRESLQLHERHSLASPRLYLLPLPNLPSNNQSTSLPPSLRTLRTDRPPMASCNSTTTTTTATTTIDNKVWLITGCSSGFGKEMAIIARKRGDHIIATARKIEALDQLQQLGCTALALDVTATDDAITSVVAKAHALYGRIDILVNNAGYSANGAVEEASTSEIQDLFDTNVFGMLRVTRAVLPYMRAQRSGTIANIGSVAGSMAYPTTGIYSATKFAVAGLTEGLRQEVAPFGIDVTTVAPDLFRTNVLPSMRLFEKNIDDYEPMKDQFFAMFSEETPMGDAAKGATAIVEALTKTGRAAGRGALPLNLYLGVTTREAITGVAARMQQELAVWAPFTEPSAFLEAKAKANVNVSA